MGSSGDQIGRVSNLETAGINHNLPIVQVKSTLGSVTVKKMHLPIFAVRTMTLEQPPRGSFSWRGYSLGSSIAIPVLEHHPIGPQSYLDPVVRKDVQENHPLTIDPRIGDLMTSCIDDLPKPSGYHLRAFAL